MRKEQERSLKVFQKKMKWERNIVPCQLKQK